MLFSVLPCRLSHPVQRQCRRRCQPQHDTAPAPAAPGSTGSTGSERLGSGSPVCRQWPAGPLAHGLAGQQRTCVLRVLLLSEKPDAADTSTPSDTKPTDMVQLYSSDAWSIAACGWPGSTWCAVRGWPWRRAPPVGWLAGVPLPPQAIQTHAPHHGPHAPTRFPPRRVGVL